MRYLAPRPSRVNGALLDFPRSVDELFQRFWGGLPALPALPTLTADIAWQPPVDVVETPQAYLLHVEIPGIDPDLIEVTLTGDVLTVRGEKRAPDQAEGETWRLGERLYSSFERTFTLPGAGSPDGVQAEARHGVLTIRVTKAKEAQPQRVMIKKV